MEIIESWSNRLRLGPLNHGWLQVTMPNGPLNHVKRLYASWTSEDNSLVGLSKGEGMFSKGGGMLCIRLCRLRYYLGQYYHGRTSR